jgi:hypothetical protein
VQSSQSDATPVFMPVCLACEVRIPKVHLNRGESTVQTGAVNHLGSFRLEVRAPRSAVNIYSPVRSLLCVPVNRLSSQARPFRSNIRHSKRPERFAACWRIRLGLAHCPYCNSFASATAVLEGISVIVALHKYAPVGHVSTSVRKIHRPKV